MARSLPLRRLRQLRVDHRVIPHAPSVRAIIFDFGGTLDGPGLPWGERFAALYREAGIELPAATLQKATAHGTRSAYRTPHVASLDLRATIAFHVARQVEHLAIEDPFVAEQIVARFLAQATAALAESRAVLTRLARRFALGVVSNFYGNLERVLGDAGFAPLLSVAVDSTVAAVSKPDPAIFTLAVARLGLRASDVLVVGDSLDQDIAPARAAGLRTAWLAGTRARPEPPPADLCLGTLGELEALLGA